MDFVCGFSFTKFIFSSIDITLVQICSNNNSCVKFSSTIKTFNEHMLYLYTRVAVKSEHDVEDKEM